MFGEFRKKRLKKKRAKILARIQKDCKHPKNIFLGHKFWTYHSNVIPGCGWYRNIFRGYEFKCKKCGKISKHDVVVCEHYRSRYISGVGHSWEKTNYITGVTTSGVS